MKSAECKNRIKRYKKNRRSKSVRFVITKRYRGEKKNKKNPMSNNCAKIKIVGEV
jgi:hypothetical protein